RVAGDVDRGGAPERGGPGVPPPRSGPVRGDPAVLVGAQPSNLKRGAGRGDRRALPKYAGNELIGGIHAQTPSSTVDVRSGIAAIHSAPVGDAGAEPSAGRDPHRRGPGG